LTIFFLHDNLNSKEANNAECKEKRRLDKAAGEQLELHPGQPGEYLSQLRERRLSLPAGTPAWTSLLHFIQGKGQDADDIYSTSSGKPGEEVTYPIQEGKATGKTDRAGKHTAIKGKAC